ncbi:MAG: hypothetical protein JWM19_2199 [Actinomycetia bacterium]|nr:hypothetical protein [Actinomycetes bacterium]
MRYFNTSGPCVPELHYMLPPEPRLPEARPLIDRELYFVVHAPRQTGKTTTLRALARQISSQGAWYDDLPFGQAATRCGYLSRSSTVLGEFSLVHGAGARYRLRALCTRSRADYSNLNTDSPWVYFQVTP